MQCKNSKTFSLSYFCQLTKNIRLILNPVLSFSSWQMCANSWLDFDVISMNLPSCVKKRVGRAVSDPSHPAYSLFRLLPSGRLVKMRTSRFQNSTFPCALKILNTIWLLHSCYLEFSLFFFSIVIKFTVIICNNCCLLSTVFGICNYYNILHMFGKPHTRDGKKNQCITILDQF